MNAAERAKAAIDVAAAFDPTDAEAHVATPHGWLAKAAECDAWSLAALGTTDAAAWRAAASACVEAWQASRERAEVREEALAALRDAEAANASVGYPANMGSVWQVFDRPDDASAVYAVAYDMALFAHEDRSTVIRSACSRAARALLLWRERMVDGE